METKYQIYQIFLMKFAAWHQAPPPPYFWRLSTSMEHLYLKEAEAAYNLSLSTNIQVDKGNYLDFELIRIYVGLLSK